MGACLHVNWHNDSADRRLVTKSALESLPVSDAMCLLKPISSACPCGPQLLSCCTIRPAKHSPSECAACSIKAAPRLSRCCTAATLVIQHCPYLRHVSYIAALLLSGGGVPAAAAADDDDSDDDDSTVRSRVDGSPSLKRNELQTYESNASSNAGPLAGGLTIPSAATKSNDDPGMVQCAAEQHPMLCTAARQNAQAAANVIQT